jgi:monoamine oxidase
LPAEKLAAMSRLKMGLYNKLYLEFPTVFWYKKAEFIEHVSEPKGMWQETLNIFYYTKKPILCMFSAAESARNFETLSDSAIVESAMASLRLIYGEKIPNPTKQIITRWG